MDNYKQGYQWAVIGGGPAGILAVGKLLEDRIPPQDILWIDPEFKVGDFGTKWYPISSNTKVQSFLKFLFGCPSFEFEKIAHEFSIMELDPQDTCLLIEMAKPLQKISQHLQNTVQSFYEMIEEISLQQGVWHLQGQKKNFCAQKVILATGALPKKLEYPQQEIPLEIALNPKKLQREIEKEDCIAVFGSSHSTMTVLDNLLQTEVRQIYNFYIEPHKYAVPFEDWILFDNTGLKGRAASFAKQFIDSKMPRRLKRIYSKEGEGKEALSQCKKVIYTVGFQPRSKPLIREFPNASYNEANGIIAPGLFGIGIAFPRVWIDPLGYKEYRVGLRKFMEDLQQMMPLWHRYGS